MAKALVKTGNRYGALISKIFFDHYTRGAKSVAFERDELVKAAKALKIRLPKNLGDVIYSFRYRAKLPTAIAETQPKGQAWIIEGVGQARYVFRLSTITRIAPNPDLLTIKIPDATPEIVVAYALSDEQALLAKVRYNRLIDIFLGITGYSLQNHLRTTVPGIGQIEIDEIYVGVDRYGRQYVIPVQAKGGADRISIVQTKQDIACCAAKFPKAICRPVSAQFVGPDLIAIFELVTDGDQVKVADEKQYRLVPADAISNADLVNYRRR